MEAAWKLAPESDTQLSSALMEIELRPRVVSTSMEACEASIDFSKLVPRVKQCRLPAGGRGNTPLLSSRQLEEFSKNFVRCTLPY